MGDEREDDADDPTISGPSISKASQKMSYYFNDLTKILQEPEKNPPTIQESWKKKIPKPIPEILQTCNNRQNPNKP